MSEPGLTFEFFRSGDAPRAATDEAFARERSFPLLFHDARSIDVLEARMTSPVETWVVRTSAPRNALLAMADTGARRTFIVTAISAMGILAGLVLSIHAMDGRPARPRWNRSSSLVSRTR